MYPTYQRALPDTTLYERLQGDYMPIQGAANPYAQFENNSLSQDALDYQADPFAYVKKKFGNLDETLKEEDKADVGLEGLFTSPSKGDSGGDTGGRNYYQEIEDRFYNENLALGATPEAARALAAQQAFEIQSANNAKINAGLTLFGNAMIPGMGAAGVAKYGPTAYADYLQGNARVMAGDRSGYQGPFTPKPAGVAAPVVSGSGGTTYSPDAIQYSAPGYTSSGSDGSSVSYTSDSPTKGTGADVTYGDTSWGTLF